MSRFHRRFLELVVMIAILLPHTCHGSCESILSLGVKGFSFGIQETLPTEPVEYSRGRPTGLGGERPGRRLFPARSRVSFRWASRVCDATIPIHASRSSPNRLQSISGSSNRTASHGCGVLRGDSGWESLTDSVLNIFRAVPPMSAPCVYSVRLASFKGSRSAMAERERVSAMVERRKLPDPLVGLEYENCVLGEYDPKRPPRLEPAGVLDQPLVRLSGRFH